jgi:hypothetical protein
MRATANPSTTSAAYAALQYFPGDQLNKPTAHLSFDLRVDAYGATDAYVAYVMAFAAQGNGAFYAVQLVVRAGVVRLSEDLQNVGPEAAPGDNCPGLSIPAAEWHHIDFSATVDGAQPFESVAIDGGPLCKRSLTLSAEKASPWKLGMSVGMPWVSQQSTAWTTHFDSVVLRVP